LVSRRVTGPLRQIQGAMLKVAAGDFSVVLPGLDRKDEIGDVANAVERFKVLADEKARTEADAVMQRQKVEADREAQLAEVEAAALAKVAKNGPHRRKNRPRRSRRSASAFVSSQAGI
jgi:methyl-accepting chemotaxis protein